MSATKRTVEKKSPTPARTKKKGTGPPKSTSAMSAMHESATEIEQLRERAVILDTLAKVCLELFMRTGNDQPKYFVRRIDSSSSVADFDVKFTVSHEPSSRPVSHAHGFGIFWAACT
jgi:hypothetical protein